MEAEEMIVELVLGAFLIFMSYQIGRKGNLALLHWYHYTNLKPEDRGIFAKRIGGGTFLTGAGVFVMPVLNLISGSELGYYAGAAMIGLGVCCLLFFIIKYNGSLTGLRRR